MENTIGNIRSIVKIILRSRFIRLVMLYVNKDMYLQKNYVERAIYYDRIYSSVLRYMGYLLVTAFLPLLCINRGVHWVVYLVFACDFIYALGSAVLIAGGLHSKLIKVLCGICTVLVVAEHIVLFLGDIGSDFSERVLVCTFIVAGFKLIETGADILWANSWYKINKDKKSIRYRGPGTDIIIRNGDGVIKRCEVRNFGVFAEDNDTICLLKLSKNKIKRYKFTYLSEYDKILETKMIKSITIGDTVIDKSNIEEYI